MAACLLAYAVCCHLAWRCLLAVLVLSLVRVFRLYGGVGGYFRLSETGKSWSASALCTMQGGSVNECWDTPRVSSWFCCVR